MTIEIPKITFFDYGDALSLKFVQLYVEKNGLMFPYMGFEDAEKTIHGKLLEKMLLMHHITDFETFIGIDRSKIPKIGGSKTNYHACGMGYAIKDEDELFILEAESGDYGIGFDKEHFELVAPYLKIKRVVGD